MIDEMIMRQWLEVSGDEPFEGSIVMINHSKRPDILASGLHIVVHELEDGETVIVRDLRNNTASVSKSDCLMVNSLRETEFIVIGDKSELSDLGVMAVENPQLVSEHGYRYDGEGKVYEEYVKYEKESVE